MTDISLQEISRDVLSVMRSMRKQGITSEAIQRMGVPTPSALIQHLRLRGYEIEEIRTDTERRYRLVTDARITGMRRKQDQMKFGEAA